MAKQYVWAPPTDFQVRIALAARTMPHGRYCTQEDAGEDLVFHRDIKTGSVGRYLWCECRACGDAVLFCRYLGRA